MRLQVALKCPGVILPPSSPAISTSPYIEKLEDWGYEARPADINKSDWHCTLERIDGKPMHALRLSFRLGKRLRENKIERIIAARGDGFASIRDPYRRTDLSIATLKTLADMDAFGSLGLNRRQVLWEIEALESADGRRAAIEDLPLFARQPAGSIQKEEAVALPEMSLDEHVLRDIATTGISLKSYVMKILRPHSALGYLTPNAYAAALRPQRDGAPELSVGSARHPVAQTAKMSKMQPPTLDHAG